MQLSGYGVRESGAKRAGAIRERTKRSRQSESRRKAERKRSGTKARQEQSASNVNEAKPHKHSVTWNISGGYGEGVPPVPLPNTEVKLIHADNSVSEDR